MKKFYSFIIISALILNMAFPITSYAAIGDLGEPRSSFELGYANMLVGKTVIVSLFVDTPSSSWDDESKAATLGALKIATKYISKNASDYDIMTSFVYDWTVDSSLSKKSRVNFEPGDADFEDKLDEKIAFWTDKTIKYDSLLKEYGAQNVFTMIFFNCEGRAYAITYDGLDIPEETLIAYSNSDPATYAHEILHLFGAHDYYKRAEYTDKVVKYINKKYPDEIMLSTEFKDGSICNTISNITAYHLGWIDDLYELQDYSELER